MRYNYITATFLSTLIILCSSCSLKEHPKDQIDEEQIYTDAQAVYQNAVLMLYSYIGGYNDGDGLQGTCRGIYDLNTFASDEAIMPTRGVDWYDGGIWQDLYFHTWSPGHEMIKNSWYYLYKVIAQCNRSIEIINRHQDLLIKIQQERYIAEVRALRAIYYWYLLDLFGRVPIVTSTTVSMNEVTQAERSQVFNFVRTELETVIPWLNKSNSTATGDYYGRVTLPVAYFVLAKLYLNAEIYCNDDWVHSPYPDGKAMTFKINDETMNAWQACQYYCNQIDDLDYSLSTRYIDNFKVYNENGTENIWVIPMDRLLYSNQQQHIVRSMHWRHASSFGFTGSNGTSASLTALQVFHYDKEDQDKRFDINYWGGIAVGKAGATCTDRLGQPLRYYPEEVKIDLKGSPYLETAGARMKKYEIDENASQKGKLMNNDIVIFRYADVLLMKAEALLRNGETGAQEYLDMIRSRAEMPSREATLDNIYDERLLELAWEGWRRNDMIRFRRYLPIHTTVFPIPSNVRSLNHNIKQNQGYE